MSEEELAVQIAEIDGVKVDDMNFTEAGQYQVLQQFAAYAASSDEKDASLGW